MRSEQKKKKGKGFLEKRKKKKDQISGTHLGVNVVENEYRSHTYINSGSKVAVGVGNRECLFII